MIAGVDEAGRGPLAGPVVASAVILGPEISGLNDSKKLTAKRRAVLFEKITQGSLAWSFATASVGEIDSINILQATKLAMQRAVWALQKTPSKVLVDGSHTIEIAMPCEAVIKGDQKEQCIMAASIVAKHIRDQMMACLALRYPQYGFLQHKGYPTKLHRQMIEEFGHSGVHRLSFGRGKTVC